MTYTKFTSEQFDIKDHIVANDGILLVSAGPGTGKSWLSERIAYELKPIKGLYTAFNKAIVLEGEHRFRNTNVKCKTFHALARSFVKNYVNVNNISDISYTCITEKISYKAKYEVIKAIDDFYVSASIDMFDFMEEVLDDIKLQELAVSYINKMIAGEIDPTFNFMLKYFHLLLVEGTVTCKYDIVILDEINDVTAVALELFKLIQAPKKLGLGETNQAIYDFLNLVNGFEELENTPILTLTQSFRCSISIAENIEKFMNKYVDKNLKFIGTDEPVKNGKFLYCTLTNAMIISKIANRLKLGKGFHLLRNISEIFSYPLAIIVASSGKKVYQKKFKFLEEEYQNYIKTRAKGDSYLHQLMKHIYYQETKSAVNLLLHLSRNNINIFSLYKNAKAVQVDFDYVIATVFTSKGLEFETVHIADDLNSRVSKVITEGGIKSTEDLVAMRCGYVAASRAGCNLENAKFLDM